MDDVTVRPELIERLGALAHEMDASAEELQAAAREWAEISAALAEADAEVAAGADHPQGDFPAVGDENLTEHAGSGRGEWTVDSGQWTEKTGAQRRVPNRPLSTVH